MEIREAITPAEERFERRRRAAGLFLGPAVFLLFYFFPIGGLSGKAASLSAVLALAVVFWLTEAMPLPVTALIAAALNAVMGVAPVKDVLEPFANPIVFLFIGSFIIAEAVALSGLDKRFVYAIFSIRFLQKNPLRALFAVGLISAGISMWISNTAATAMVLPIGVGMISAMRDMSGGASSRVYDYKGYAASMMLMVAYAASVGGIATPVGTPPNLIGIGLIQQMTGVKITFFQWMAFAVPLTVAMFIVLFLLLSRNRRPFGAIILSGMEDYVRSGRRALGRWKRAEVNTAAAFAAAVILWVMPGIVSGLFGQGAAAKLIDERLNEGVAAVIAAGLLFLLPASPDGKARAMTWERAARIDWGTILLFGGGLSLGKLMVSTGLAEAVGGGFTSLTGASSLWGITAAGTFFAIILSEMTSNTASANMVIPLMIAAANAAGVSPLPPALGACLGGSFGFMLPVSTPPNAIVYGSGLVPVLTMVRKGIIFHVCGFILIMAGLMILCPLMGWT
ncbi:MAG: DASS family sodium-coupled anion symporter [Deltaproteobacteria bacterium]|nr:DASS family sodium-coupled anion symporter [Deltaproteobacteria bacterium]